MIIAVEDHVLFVLDAAVSLPQAVTVAPDLWIGSHKVETPLQAVEIVNGLIRTPVIQRIIADLDQVEAREPGEPIAWHLLESARHHCPPADALADLADDIPVGNAARFAGFECGTQRF